MVQTYLMQPRAGVLEAGDTVDVTVTYLPEKGEPDHRLQLCAHPVEAAQSVTRDTWRAFFTDHIETQEIPVLFRQAFASPEPIAEKRLPGLTEESFASQREDEFHNDMESSEGNLEFGNEGKAQPEELSQPQKQMTINTAAFDRVLKKPTTQQQDKSSAPAWVPPPSEGPAKRTESFSKPRADPRASHDTYAPHDSWSDDAPRRRQEQRVLREKQYGVPKAASERSVASSSREWEDDDDYPRSSKAAKAKTDKEEGMNPIMKAVLGALLALLAFNLYVRPLADSMSSSQ
eukprot:gnl/MRDRNA2_/MRDRNA2_62081_c0_seq3.p1 gnl/MRDRNA2_/MRDRNA2_62081_c0~~gnl/MRDRNA2_/MRDRNA2_62081_c0_seq3.p1  ORF type:complete len:289 (+),score=65.07 gnl/MRDRNA2_/MRDRNA2_62081_c0_seq3:101-967(+)